MTDLPVYSPSETEDYLQCPRYRVLRRAIEPRTAVWAPNITLGNTIHAGLAMYYDPRQHERSVADAQAIARATLEEGYQEQDEWTLEGLWQLAQRGMKATIDADLLNGVVIGTELAISRMRLDVLERYPDGLQTLDWKVKLKLEKRNLPYRVADFDPSWQLLQNAWGVRQAYGETPKWARAVLIVLSPRVFIHPHAIKITDERLDDFGSSCAQVWRGMEGDRLAYDEGVLPPMNTRSCNAYGRPCDFKPFCHDLYGDMQQALATLYQPKEDTRSDEEHRAL